MVSPSSQQVFVTSSGSNTLTTFDVGGGGALVQRNPSFGGCFAVSGRRPVRRPPGLSHASDLTLSRDGRFVYVDSHFNGADASGNAITAYPARPGAGLRSRRT